MRHVTRVRGVASETCSNDATLSEQSSTCARSALARLTLGYGHEPRSVSARYSPPSVLQPSAGVLDATICGGDDALSHAAEGALLGSRASHAAVGALLGVGVTAVTASSSHLGHTHAGSSAVVCNVAVHVSSSTAEVAGVSIDAPSRAVAFSCSAACSSSALNDDASDVFGASATRTSSYSSSSTVDAATDATISSERTCMVKLTSTDGVDCSARRSLSVSG